MAIEDMFPGRRMVSAGSRRLEGDQKFTFPSEEAVTSADWNIYIVIVRD